MNVDHEVDRRGPIRFLTIRKAKHPSIFLREVAEDAYSELSCQAELSYPGWFDRRFWGCRRLRHPLD